MNMLDRNTRMPLHITISSLFISLVLILGGLLSWQSYNKTSDIILSSAERVYAQIAEDIQLDLRATYRPVVESLKLLALSPLSEAQTLEQRLSSLPLLRAALSDDSAVAAIQVGYANGDYFVVRSLVSAVMRNTFDAPAEARFVVDDITAGTQQLQRLFLDADLKLTRKNPSLASDYDPRQRPWYTRAGAEPKAIDPYLFYFIGEVGTTLTLRTPTAGVVIAADVSLAQLSATIARHQITPHSEVVLLNADGRALAYPDSDKLVQRTGDDTFSIAALSALGSPVLDQLDKDLRLEPQKLDFQFDGRHWTGRISKIARASGLDLSILMVSPLDELLSDAVAIRQSSLLATALIVTLTIPIVWLLANRIAGPLRKLAAEAEAMRRFEFDNPVTASSFITEVDLLARAMRMMKKTIKQFLFMINSLAGEKDIDPLLVRVTHETMTVSLADVAVTYLVDDDEQYLHAGAVHTRSNKRVSLPDISLDGDHPLVRAFNKQDPEVLSLTTESATALQALRALVGEQEATLVAVPLRNRKNEPIGLLCLLYGGHYDTRERDYSAQIAFMRALSGFAAVTIESRHLLKMQKGLLDAFIQLIAGAIDAKSPYTGGHCQRVPELTRMIAQAACDSDAPPFSDYQLTEDEWEALHIASWLHDCGKVTMPEYVVDKATKLETIYDRIHEVRMRFEVLKRDAGITYWKKIAEGGDPSSLQKALADELARLDDDFAFIAECNEGGEYMAPERVARLRRIAARTWQRTLDDRIGISWEERQRKERTAAMPLPATEKLIADKPEHLMERADSDRMPADNPWGFNLDVPEYLYNRGELYNLQVARGTLSAEERYKINDHMVQTIIMLEKLPYPKHLRDVPEIASCHHETMDGKGYPRRLTREQMSLTARMMAIADIFEALTAADRPYKKAKTIGEAIRILSFMRDEQHIDPALFELFLTSGVWRRYAERYLKPEQMDEVDINQYLGKPGSEHSCR
jgi:HD-GYP domain-containing protein (c-di-GMP phosphodiesterase class II)